MRDCLPCTACCRGSLEFQTPKQHITRGRKCKFVTADGCKRHKNRFAVCKEFQCGWTALPHPEEMRPDLCGAIHIRRKDYDIITAVDEIIPEKTKEYFIQWARMVKRPIIIKELHVDDGEKYTAIKPVGPQVFRREAIAAAKAGQGFR